MMNSQVRLMLIGRGHWGQVYVKNIQQYTSFPSISLPETHIFGRDYEQALSSINPQDVDGVIVAVSSTAHFDVASTVLKHGFHSLLIEKPLVASSAQAIKLQELTKTIPNAMIMVGHTLLYDAAYIEMKNAATRLGTLRQIHYTSLKAPRIEGPSILPDAGSPPIYLFLDIAGQMPATVAAKPLQNDNVEMTLVFPDGLRAVAIIGTIYPERKREITMTGDHGSLTLNEFINPRELTCITADQKTVLTFPTDQTALQRELQAFAECITTGKKPHSSLTDGARVVKIIELAEQSFNHGGTPVPYPYENPV